MIFEDFFQLINNTFWDVKDPTNRDQCFDLVIGWCKAMGIRDDIFSGIVLAKDLWYKPTQLMRDTFNFIQNTPTAIPKKGDILVFDGVVGHTSVATDKADLNMVTSFDQNFPTGSNCRLVTHNYDNPKILGWLRAKNQPSSTTLKYTIDWKEKAVAAGEDVNAPKYADFRAIDTILQNERITAPIITI